METLFVQNVQKKLKHFSLRAHFHVAAGERLGLQGESGCGKSTLLRIISGLESFDSGSLHLGNQRIDAVPSEKRNIGFVFQDQSLFPTLNIIENIVFPLKIRGHSKAEATQMARAWLERAGMKNHELARIETLSGGERQKVALIRALIWNPAIVLLDEPFSALDRNGRNRLKSEILELHEKQNAPLILVSHDEADLNQLATRSLVLKQNEKEHVHAFEENGPK